MLNFKNYKSTDYKSQKHGLQIRASWDQRKKIASIYEGNNHQVVGIEALRFIMTEDKGRLGRVFERNQAKANKPRFE